MSLNSYRFVMSPFNPFKVSIQYPVKRLFGLFTTWHWVCRHGQFFTDFDGDQHLVAAEFPSIEAAKGADVFEANGVRFVSEEGK